MYVYTIIASTSHIFDNSEVLDNETNPGRARGGGGRTEKL
jgi:hypothetical protein